jgi:hypothetical protein
MPGVFIVFDGEVSRRWRYLDLDPTGEWATIAPSIGLLVHLGAFANRI